MALQYSVKFKNALLDTGSLKSVFEGVSDNEGYIVVYSGPVPASPEAALDLVNNHVLAVYSRDPNNGATINGYTCGVATANGLLLEATAVDGNILKLDSQTWSAKCLETGDASFFRYERSPSHANVNGGTSLGGSVDDGSIDSSFTKYRIQGLVGGAGADLIVQNNTYTAGTTYTLQFFSIAVPAL